MVLTAALLLSGTPTGRCVRNSSDFGVRDRAHNGSHLRLNVTFHGGFGRAAAFFSPHESNFGTGLRVFGRDHGESEVFAFIRTVAAPRRHSDRLSVQSDLVIGK